MATAQFASVWSLFVIMFGGIVLTVAVGMPISTLIYVLQPWFFESQSWRQTFARSSGLVLGDIGACFLTTMLWVTICLNIGTIVWRLPPDLGSPVGRVALIFAAIVIAILLFPPLPIWMALLYYRETSAYSGADLAARIAEWQRQDTAPAYSATCTPTASRLQCRRPNRRMSIKFTLTICNLQSAICNLQC